MPETRTKAQIIDRLQTERRRLEKNLAHLRREEMVVRGVVGESSVKDILAHLADWESRMPVWIQAARRGDPVESPEPGLTWKQLNILNQRIYKAHSKQSLGQVLEYFRTAHERLMDMVQAMPEDEMLSRGRYAFIGKGAVFDWLNAYAAHDLWGKRKIRSWARARQQSENKPKQQAGRPGRRKATSESKARPIRRARGAR